mgnify:CR=1 FL=1
MRMRVHPFTVVMHVLVRMRRQGSVSRQRPQRGPQIQCTQENEHERHAKLEAQPEPRRDDDPEQNNRSTHHQQGETVTEPPVDASQSGAPDAALSANDRSHRHDMIGIRGVSHPEEETQEQNGEQCDHGASGSGFMMSERSR